MNWMQINGFLENWTWKEEKIVISYTKFFEKKSCFVGFFYEKRTINKNQQFNFLSQNLSLESNYFKWDGKETKIYMRRLLFHRIWREKKMFSCLRFHYLYCVSFFNSPHSNKTTYFPWLINTTFYDDFFVYSL